METTTTVEKRTGMLYPLMLLAAIAVIVFSVVGIATMMGWMPSALSTSEPAVKAGPAKTDRAPAAQAVPGRPRAVASAPAAPCHDCGVIESIRVVEMQGDASGVGAVTGGVVGGILGNQVGRGSGRSAMTVVGAGAGAYAGHEIEKKMNRSSGYQIRVRMGDGTYRTFFERSQPAFSVGQKVRVTDNGIVAAG